MTVPHCWNAFTGFAFEITEALRADGNRLEIDVIDPRVPVRIDADPATGEAKAHYTRLTASGAERRTVVRAFGKPELWCPENPKLYTFVIEEGEDRLEVPFGSGICWAMGTGF